MKFGELRLGHSLERFKSMNGFMKQKQEDTSVQGSETLKEITKLLTNLDKLDKM